MAKKNKIETPTGKRAYIKAPIWDRKEVRNTRDGRSIESIIAQVDRIRDNHVGTDTYYNHFGKAEDIAGEYQDAIRAEMRRRASANPYAVSPLHAQYLRDGYMEDRAMLGREYYDKNYKKSAKGNVKG